MSFHLERLFGGASEIVSKRGPGFLPCILAGTASAKHATQASLTAQIATHLLLSTPKSKGRVEMMT